MTGVYCSECKLGWMLIVYCCISMWHKCANKRWVCVQACLPVCVRAHLFVFEYEMCAIYRCQGDLSLFTHHLQHFLHKHSSYPLFVEEWKCSLTAVIFHSSRICSHGLILPFQCAYDLFIYLNIQGLDKTFDKIPGRIKFWRVPY